MAARWREIPLRARMLTNVNDEIVERSSPMLENLFINEAGGQSRFPGLRHFASLPYSAPVYLWEWRGDLIGVCAGRVYRLDHNANQEDVTDVIVGGSSRVSFTETESELVMAAGERIVRLAKDRTEILAENAPESTHVAFVDSYVMGIEEGSGRFWWSDPGEYQVWDDLSTLSADGNPDNLTAALVTPHRELILAGPKSIEQFERLASGTTPFFRRWSLGEGILAPGTLIAADNAVWFVNDKAEFIRASGQIGLTASDDVQVTLEGIRNWEGAWCAQINTAGQKFMLLQAPHATNPRNTEGLTLIYDIRRRAWYFLYGWDAATGQHACWPGRSTYRMWDRNFVGLSTGRICELDQQEYQNDGQIMRVGARTGHVRDWGHARIDNVRLHVKRGNVAQNSAAPLLGVRANQDLSRWSNWVHVNLGLTGQRYQVVDLGPFGDAYAWQFEWFVSDDSEFEMVKMEALVSELRH